jgi:hypothetical protein
MIIFECEALKHVDEPSRTFAIRNIMINKIRSLTPSVMKKMDDETLYGLYLAANNVIGEEPSVIGCIKNAKEKINE